MPSSHLESASLPQVTHASGAGGHPRPRALARSRVWLLGTVLLCAMVLVCLALQPGIDGWRLVIRATARTSLVCFLLAYLAQAAVVTWPGPGSAWLRAHRRTWGWLLVTSHALHGMAIIVLAQQAPALFASLSPPASRWGPGLAYVVIALMGLTSFDRTAAWVGPKVWSRLHTWGSHFLWLSFFLAYARRVPTQPFSAVPCIVLALALGWRLWAARRSTSRAPVQG